VPEVVDGKSGVKRISWRVGKKEEWDLRGPVGCVEKDQERAREALEKNYMRSMTMGHDRVPTRDSPESSVGGLGSSKGRVGEKFTLHSRRRSEPG